MVSVDEVLFNYGLLSLTFKLFNNETPALFNLVSFRIHMN
jgi:hypothetical protein